MTQKTKNILIVTVSLILSLFLLIVLVVLAPSREDCVCTKVSVSVVDGDKYKFISVDDIHRQMDLKNMKLEGKPLDEIDIHEIETKLEEHPMLRNVECYLNNKGVVSIDVEQRVPLFRVISPGRSFYVDSDRNIMPLVFNHLAYLPIVTGNVNPQFATLELFDFILYLQNDNFMASLIEQIYVHSNNSVEIVPRVGQFRIIVGTLDRYEAKINKLKTFYNEVLPEVGWDKYSTINLDYKDQVVAK